MTSIIAFYTVYDKFKNNSNFKVSIPEKKIILRKYQAKSIMWWNKKYCLTWVIIDPIRQPHVLIIRLINVMFCELL